MRYEKIRKEFEIIGNDMIEEELLPDSELAWLEYLAEHPELTDPVIWFLPQPQKGKRTCVR